MKDIAADFIFKMGKKHDVFLLADFGDFRCILMFIPCIFAQDYGTVIVFFDFGDILFRAVDGKIREEKLLHSFVIFT